MDLLASAIIQVFEKDREMTHTGTRNLAYSNSAAFISYREIRKSNSQPTEMKCESLKLLWFFSPAIKRVIKNEGSTQKLADMQNFKDELPAEAGN